MNVTSACEDKRNPYKTVIQNLTDFPLFPRYGEDIKTADKTMKRILVKIITLVLLLHSLSVQPARAAGATYYVSTSGSDGYPGTMNLPWRTIQKAANVAQAGDTVYVRGGTYREKVIVSNSGAEGNYITFSSYPGETAVIDVNGISMTNYHEGGFTINHKNYIRVIGFRVINSKSTGNGGFGIVCYQSDHCVIRNNRTYNTYRSGIISRSSTNVTIDGNDVELANNNGEQEMITVSGGAFITVTNNHVHHGGPGTNGGEGINILNGAHDVLVKGNHVHHNPRAGIYVDAYKANTYNITIDGNIVHDNQRTGIAIEAEVSGFGLDNIVVVNNLVYRNVRSGIVLGDWGRGTLRNIAIVNNTVAQNGIGTGHGGIGLWNDRARNVIVRNNILSQNESFTIEAQGTPLSETTISHNLLDGYRNRPNETRGTNYVEGDPLFVNAASFDFDLLAGSPAINKGTGANAPSRDIVDYSRNIVDIGAYEFQGAAPAVVFTETFNTAFTGWTKSGKVVWYTGAPRIGGHSIRLAGDAYILRKISTRGYENLTLVIYLGAGSYENTEFLQLSWWNGSAWKALTAIKNGSPRENNKLNRLTFTLPAAAANRADFKIRIRQAGADLKDYGYIDSIQLSGTAIP